MASRASETKTLCLIDGCGRKAHCRGLCNSCYQTARAAVANGETNWEQLEEKGLANAVTQHHHKENPFRKALDEALAG